MTKFLFKFFLYLNPVWEFSSAGSEHLPYKQRVGGSNPSTPTKANQSIGFFFTSLSTEFSTFFLRKAYVI